ncbi:MAG: hypothetical protein LDL13_08860 [Calditerrivibrio sp.]|nr:hypothetical protein [Calditerrivibrio sp.]MCA1933675.1 hypothetical protein [Calditerrivibrio sp.]
MVIFIVVFSVGVMGLMSLFYNTFAKIYDPTARLKGIQVAQGFMEEIYGKYWDNDTYFSDNGSIELSLANIGREESTDDIAQFDDLDDFVKCSSGVDCPCSVTEYDSADVGLTPGYKIKVKVSYADTDASGDIVEECINRKDLKMVTVTVRHAKDYNGETYELKYVKGNF